VPVAIHEELRAIGLELATVRELLELLVAHLEVDPLELTLARVDGRTARAIIATVEEEEAGHGT
jgi:hypothetical protein